MFSSCIMVLTTIHASSILDGYLANFERYGHLDRVQVIVIPDRKTPTDVFTSCAALCKRGLRVVCPTLAEQETFLSRLGVFASLVPFDSDNRRNIGYLMALERGCDFMISIDDDNFCRPEGDFVGAHSVVCQPPHPVTLSEARDGWLNVCRLLILKPPEPQVYARGYPYRQRHREEVVKQWSDQGSIRLHAGLWLGDPDLDAMTWLVAPVQATGMKENAIILGPHTWSPINTQNTALARDLIPAYYFVRMGYPLSGLTLERYGDIFSGYFVRACMRHLGDWVRFGTPLVEHRRNAHHHLLDATREMACVWILEDVTEWLREAKLDGTTYAETYVSLSHALEEMAERASGFIWTDATRAYVHQTAYCMRAWVKACRVLGLAAA